MKGRSLWQIGLLCIMAVLAIGGCAPPATIRSEDPARVSIRDLLLTTDDVPARWQIYNISSVPEGSSLDVGEENLMVSFAISSAEETRGGLAHHVYRFKSTASAARAFEFMVDDRLFFVGAEANSVAPAGWEYRSPIAQDWRVACIPGFCSAIARYEEYISILSSSAGQSGLTLTEFSDVLKAIDQRVEQKQGKAFTAHKTYLYTKIPVQESSIQERSSHVALP